MPDPLEQAVDDAIEQVGGLERELLRLHSLLRLATKQDVEQVRCAIMSKISEFADRQNAFNTRLETAIDGLTADVQNLKALVEQLQNSAGEITPEDQATLDQLEARVRTAVEKAEALDALTENTPTPPV